jgi:hypothetical protein
MGCMLHAFLYLHAQWPYHVVSAINNTCGLEMTLQSCYNHWFAWLRASLFLDKQERKDTSV